MFGLRAFSISNPKMKKKNEFKNNTQIPPTPPPSQNKNKTKQNKQQNCTPINVLFEKNINITV